MNSLSLETVRTAVAMAKAELDQCGLKVGKVALEPAPTVNGWLATLYIDGMPADMAKADEAMQLVASFISNVTTENVTTENVWVIPIYGHGCGVSTANAN